MTATANGSSSPLRTPADPTYALRPKKCRNKAAAIGERIAFKPQANSTACGLSARPAAAMRYPFQCSTQTKVNRRRAVSKSTSIFSFSRSINSSELSLCSPRRPMSIASIWLGVAVRIAL